MALDLRIEIFAFKWFNTLLFPTEPLSKLHVKEIYNDECLALPEWEEMFKYNFINYPIILRTRLFKKLYLEEIFTEIEKLLLSETDFYDYVLRTCNRVDLFGNLTIFERIFATCTFVYCLCVHFQYDYPEVYRHGYICWAMYFDQFSDEFFNRGGWKRLELVAISYNLPMSFLGSIGIKTETAEVLLIKVRKAMASYRLFKRIGVSDHDKCVAISWVKFYSQCVNDDFDQVSVDFHSNGLNFSEIEDILKEMKYLCDPDGSEMVKHMVRMSSIDSLEIPMGNLTIRESKQETVLESELDKSTTANSASKSPEKRKVAEKALTCQIPGKIGSVSETDHMDKDFKLQNQGDVKTATVEHLCENMTISDWEGKNEVNKSEILTALLPSTRKNTEGEDFNKIPYDLLKEQDETKIIKEASDNGILTEQIFSKEQNVKKKNTNEMKGDERNEQGECKIKNIKNSTNRVTQIPFSKRVVLKENSRPNQDTKKQKGKHNTILTGKMCSTCKKDNKEKESRNSIREERKDNDVKNLLRMILVLGKK